MKCELCGKWEAIQKCLECGKVLCDHCFKEHRKVCVPKPFWED